MSIVAAMIAEASIIRTYALKINGNNLYFVGKDKEEARLTMLAFWQKYYAEHKELIVNAIVYTVTDSGLQQYDYRII